ncbi:hypothetical protein L596_005995 [Steinernema carpocapsae]|uniref:Uncharacterized protein n=1 Tax=Steinernema carpocapsae TaxID=34508 RepID=A0A4U8V0W2_STECR|nr:hypothetical protein L596_005995 [Steinernema carpocapsae]
MLGRDGSTMGTLSAFRSRERSSIAFSASFKCMHSNNNMLFGIFLSVDVRVTPACFSVFKLPNRKPRHRRCGRGRSLSCASLPPENGRPCQRLVLNAPYRGIVVVAGGRVRVTRTRARNVLPEKKKILRTADCMLHATYLPPAGVETAPLFAVAARIDKEATKTRGGGEFRATVYDLYNEEIDGWRHSATTKQRHLLELKNVLQSSGMLLSLEESSVIET